MIIKNYTPHEITIYSHDGKTVIGQIPSIGIARAVEVCVNSEPINGIPVVNKNYNKITGLPEPEYNTVYIVSLPVLQVSDREDIVCPDTGPESAVRENGKILGVRRFQK